MNAIGLISLATSEDLDASIVARQGRTVLINNPSPPLDSSGGAHPSRVLGRASRHSSYPFSVKTKSYLRRLRVLGAPHSSKVCFRSSSWTALAFSTGRSVATSAISPRRQCRSSVWLCRCIATPLPLSPAHYQHNTNTMYCADQHKKAAQSAQYARYISTFSTIF
jgi:hypothetical protein